MLTLWKKLAAAAAISAIATGVTRTLMGRRPHAAKKKHLSATGKKIAHDAVHAGVHLTDPHKHDKKPA
jgi:hypothetical protein